MAVDVVLVNLPALHADEQGPLVPPLGLIYVGTVLRTDGFDVRLFDFQDELLSLDKLLALVQSDQPAWVGLSANSENIFRVERLCQKILQTNDRTLCVLGGPHVSALPEPYIGPRTIVVRRDGEYPALLLTRLLVRGEGRLQDIPGICYLENGSEYSQRRGTVAAGTTQTQGSAGSFASECLCEEESALGVAVRPASQRAGHQVVINPLGQGPFENVSAIPIPDYALLQPIERYVPSVITSRGCPYRCKFCVEGSTDVKCRPRKLEDVRRELEMIRDLRSGEPIYLTFSDDTFTHSRRRVSDICDLLNEVFPDKKRFAFYCEGRADVLASDLELVRRLREAGLIRLQLGIESGDQAILESIGKSTRREHVERVVQACTEFDVDSVFGAFILGLPEHTEKHLQDAIRFARQLTDLAPGRFETMPTILCPFPGTEYRNRAEHWGLQVHDPDFVTGYTTNDCFVQTRNLTHRQIVDYFILFRREMEKYYLAKLQSVTPSQIRRMFKVMIRFGGASMGMRTLLKFSHVLDLVRMYRQPGFGFLEDLSEHPLESLCPHRVPGSLNYAGDGLIANQSSPFGYLVTREESDIYRLFAGKLTFGEIVDRMQTQGTAESLGLHSRDRLVNKILEVYQKAEDRLNGLVSRV